MRQLSRDNIGSLYCKPLMLTIGAQELVELSVMVEIDLHLWRL